MKRRVVVTGLGIVSPLGNSVKTAWGKLVRGESGLKKLEGKEYEQIPCRVAAPLSAAGEELNILNYINKSEERTMSPATMYGLIAGTEALKDARWTPTDSASKQRTAVCVGMGMVDLVNICEAGEALKKSYKRVSPYFVPRILPNMAAGQISMKFGFQGPNHTVSTACATGCHAIGDGFRFVQRGDADVAVCGGAEACISPIAIAGFCRMRALSTSFNDRPTESSRPFDKERDGFVMGEGSAILVLEELNHALNRGATIYSEILGYGLSGDASHITAPHEDGIGALLAMSRALEDSHLQPGDVTYINAHATSTPLGDAIELKAIKSLFKSHVGNLKVSSTKGAHGHLLGAAGNLESLFTVLACHFGIIPPTINLNNPCEEAEGIDCVPNLKQDWNADRKIALKNSFGFGGTNACICIAKYKH
ncbi:hypothetical protein AAG570_000567 [Ranatra chinensis]|uniref:3-oxoacyl-[acyl-carrier-protein] synthase n=1 Tax=Ranatra chinensis TaxID=642074 RepID=A0ABD0Z7U2_9HEMI